MWRSMLCSHACSQDSFLLLQEVTKFLKSWQFETKKKLKWQRQIYSSRNKEKKHKIIRWYVSPWHRQCRRRLSQTLLRLRAGKENRRSCISAFRPCLSLSIVSWSTRGPWCCPRSASLGPSRTWRHRPPGPRPGWWWWLRLRTAKQRPTGNFFAFGIRYPIIADQYPIITDYYRLSPIRTI